MTITQADETTFQTTIAQFHAQHEEDACYPTAIKNILDELEARIDKPSANLSLSDIKELGDYRKGFGVRDEIVRPNLSAELSSVGLSAEEVTGFDYDDLRQILENENASMPIVELDPGYCDDVTGYRAQASSAQPAFSHTVVVFKINDEEVLFYDPFESFFKRSSRVKEIPYRMNRTRFYELWQGDYDPGWTFWIEISEQQTFDEVATRGDNQ